ncbi:Trm112 family protein [Desulfopila sp. IMCC35008]|uniref:class I SAM-dependent methyltransferase n=1 Tax=Desulfopila sp. IMCC35008 TaxID=2653858 RepID=UPI0013D7BFAF|nr:Trm112 family protein [Desulfopila sp. IMCC35008]
MKTQMLELLICPICLPKEFPLIADIVTEQNGDIETGSLTCPSCMVSFPITDGIANLNPMHEPSTMATNKYETEAVVASYLWSHFSELTGDEHSSQAYSTWAEVIEPHNGIALDAGGAVGRFSFEMSNRSDFSIGLDTSVAFIRVARELMKKRTLTVGLKDEGSSTKEFTVTLPDRFMSEKVEFIVANALSLPFRENSIGSFSSLNLVDKVPSPIKHLQEMSRVTRNKEAQFVLSDPFSWSDEAAPIREWLGGQPDGPYTGRGIDTISGLLKDPKGTLQPAWKVSEPENVWWKIRTHTNHYELIQSCFVHAKR